MEIDERLVAPCGLFCGACIERQESKTCRGCGCECGECAAQAHHEHCRIYQCCAELQGLRTCGECYDFPCTRLIQFTYDPIWRSHLPVLDNLRRIQRMGLSAWVCEQEDYWKETGRLERWLQLQRECHARYMEAHS